MVLYVHLIRVKLAKFEFFGSGFKICIGSMSQVVKWHRAGSTSMSHYSQDWVFASYEKTLLWAVELSSTYRHSSWQSCQKLPTCYWVDFETSIWRLSPWALSALFISLTWHSHLWHFKSSSVLRTFRTFQCTACMCVSSFKILQNLHFLTFYF